MKTFSINRVAVLILSIVTLLQAGSAAAFGLMQAFDAALQNDPTYRAAVHENAAGQQFTSIGRSFYFPTYLLVIPPTRISRTFRTKQPPLEQ